MTLLYNQKRLKQLRRNLRKNKTKTEAILWNYLRRKQIKGIRFLRQYSVSNYILDFYCPQRKLALEIDGGQHTLDEVELKDQKRTVYLKSKGIKVLRFWNNEVFENIDGIIEKIGEELE